MPRSRAFLTLCAMVACLAWTNVQAMTCCWAWGAGAAQEALHNIDRNGDRPGDAAQRAKAPDAASAPSASCHGAETAPAATPEPDPQAAETHSESTPDADGQGTHAATPAPSSPCHLISPVVGNAHPVSCCDTPAPAEAFSAVPHFESLPPQTFPVALRPAPSFPTFATHVPDRSPGSPHFLALERLLI